MLIALIFSFSFWLKIELRIANLNSTFSFRGGGGPGLIELHWVAVYKIFGAFI